ncbi:hypothetical protein [Pediococcus pentosaceus]|jgi:hypothetical protein|uniref:hypothetical protein n=1 Tax=Pediococcus pentosaceus TaxID=1255 RepID=UPI0003C33B03|nr:hypothetical protein [Pediococcus pentosaceus]AHA05943.1 hypothetical protein T256_04825 [Pediococcus pentosaceus SL4]KAF0524298.1 hypothetical protein GBP32_01735 [Pediococcus pentosaceus]
MNEIKITYMTPNTDNLTTRIEFTAKFQGTNDNVSGSINVTNDDITNAYHEATASDPYAGHRTLVASKLADEFKQAIGTKEA